MIGNRYAPLNMFALIPELTLTRDAELPALDHLLEDDTLFARSKHDLPARHPQYATRGRNSTLAEAIRRMLMVRRLFDWSYEET